VRREFAYQEYGKEGELMSWLGQGNGKCTHTQPESEFEVGDKNTSFQERCSCKCRCQR